MQIHKCLFYASVVSKVKSCHQTCLFFFFWWQTCSIWTYLNQQIQQTSAVSVGRSADKPHRDKMITEILESLLSHVEQKIMSKALIPSWTGRRRRGRIKKEKSREETKRSSLRVGSEWKLERNTGTQQQRLPTHTLTSASEKPVTITEINALNTKQQQLNTTPTSTLLYIFEYFMLMLYIYSVFFNF